jgi:hypothetical protein
MGIKQLLPIIFALKLVSCGTSPIEYSGSESESRQQEPEISFGVAANSLPKAVIWEHRFADEFFAKNMPADDTCVRQSDLLIRDMDRLSNIGVIPNKDGRAGFRDIVLMTHYWLWNDSLSPQFKKWVYKSDSTVRVHGYPAAKASAAREAFVARIKSLKNSVCPKPVTAVPVEPKCQYRSDSIMGRYLAQNGNLVPGYACKVVGWNTTAGGMPVSYVPHEVCNFNFLADGHATAEHVNACADLVFKSLTGSLCSAANASGMLMYSAQTKSCTTVPLTLP